MIVIKHTKKTTIALLGEMKTMEKTAKRLGVSSNAIRKHCKRHNIDYHKALLSFPQ